MTCCAGQVLDALKHFSVSQSVIDAIIAATDVPLPSTVELGGTVLSCCSKASLAACRLLGEGGEAVPRAAVQLVRGLVSFCVFHHGRLMVDHLLAGRARS